MIGVFVSFEKFSFEGLTDSSWSPNQLVEGRLESCSPPRSTSFPIQCFSSSRPMLRCALHLGEHGHLEKGFRIQQENAAGESVDVEWHVHPGHTTTLILFGNWSLVENILDEKNMRRSDIGAGVVQEEPFPGDTVTTAELQVHGTHELTGRTRLRKLNAFRSSVQRSGL